MKLISPYRIKHILFLIYFGLFPLTLVNAFASNLWIKEFEEADSYKKLSRLKKCCYDALSEEAITFKVQDKWQQRLLSVIKKEGALDRRSSLLQVNKNLSSHSTSRPLSFTPVYSKKRSSKERDRNLKNPLPSLTIELQSVSTKKKPAKYDIDTASPYKIRFIEIDNHNPKVLNLHGVAKASLAEKKVSEFIRAAKSCRKEKIIIITGKGNHLNYRGQRGTIFKALPTWISDNPLIKNYSIASDGGSYIIILNSSLKLMTKNQYMPIKRQEEAFNLQELYKSKKDNHLKNKVTNQIYHFMREKRYREHKIKNLFRNNITTSSEDKWAQGHYPFTRKLKEQVASSLKSHCPHSSHNKTLNDFLTPTQKKQLGM